MFNHKPELVETKENQRKVSPINDIHEKGRWTLEHHTTRERPCISSLNLIGNYAHR